jgi:hypothetical protein
VQKYCYALRKFFSFCLLFNSGIILPVDSLSVAKYLAYMRYTGSAHSAFKLIVVAIKWLNSFIPGVNKFNCPLEDQFLLKLRDSAARNVPKTSNQKQPMDGGIVKQMLLNLSTDATLIQIRNVLMPAMSYSLLLRYDELSHLNCKFVVKVEKGLKILIPSSKTDSFREGKTVFLSRQTEGTSVFDLFERYMQISGLILGENHFLFAPIFYGKIVNEKLSYSTYLSIVKSQIASLGLNPAFYGTHSLRSGGASDLASKVTEFELLLTGRWRDPNSLKSYVKVSEARRFAISDHLFLD